MAVNREPSGLAETLMMQDAASLFEGWERVKLSVTPRQAFGVIGHMEAGAYNSPGDAPIVWGLSRSGVVPGSVESAQIADRVNDQKGRLGAEWDLSAEEMAQKFMREWNDNPRSRMVDYASADAARAAGVQFTPPEDDTTLFGVLKGTSRWLMMVLDIVPEGLDALGRAVSQVSSGNLTASEAFGGMFGFDRQAAQSVGIPLFQYLRSAFEGERLNMGTGWFAQGEIPEDIANQMALYDAETHGVADPEGVVHGGLTQTDFLERQDQMGGRLLVEGLNGMTYHAKSLDEWIWLRDNVGRAALLSNLQEGFSLQQETLGIPHGAYQERIFDEATVMRRNGNPNGTWFSHSVGRTATSPFLEPDTTPFNLVSGTLDFGKQLVDLPVAKAIAGVTQLVSGANRFVGLGGEMGDLARGTSTLNSILAGADGPARAAATIDLQRGAINVDRATEAVARQGDTALMGADNTVSRLRTLGREPGTYGERLDVAQIDKRINAGIANPNSWQAGWLADVWNRAADVPRGADEALEELRTVAARPGVDLINGRYGTAEVADEIRASARESVEHLDGVLRNRGGSVILDPTNGGHMLTFDAEIGRASGTLSALHDLVSRQHAAAQALYDIRKRVALPVGQRMRDPRLRKKSWAQIQAMVDEAEEAARAVGLDPSNLKGIERMGRRSADEVEGVTRGLDRKLLEDHWAQGRRPAEKVLGDTDEAKAEVDNLIRVLRREDGEGLISSSASNPRPRLEPGDVQRLLTGQGKAADLVDALDAADTVAEVLAILHRTVEFSGKIPSSLVERLAHAADRDEIVEIFTRMAAGQQILPNKMALMGKAARYGALTTLGGTTVGAAVGAGQEIAEGGDLGDVLGGLFTGAVLGTMAGSGISSPIAHLMGGTTRKIEDVADAMDLLLAGSRSVVSEAIQKSGIKMGRAQQGLTIPSMLNYAYGDSALGRRLMRSASNYLNLNDPTDFFYKLADYSRSLGLHLDEQVEVFKLGTGPGAKVEKLIRSTFDSPEAYAARADELISDGYRVTNTYSMDDVLSRAATMQANNPARGHEVLTRFGAMADAVLASKGMSEARIDMLTDMFRQGAQEFMGATNAMAKPAAYAQRLVKGNTVYDLSKGARLESELWSGHIDLPDPARVFRAVNQLDVVGRTVQMFTGAGVAKQVRANMRRVSGGGDWQKITPELERNVAMRIARNVTSSMWATAILLGRPMAFASRVLGEDQARMTASRLDSFFYHPANYLSAIAANFEFFRKHGFLRGTTFKSHIPRDLLDDAGELNPSVLDNMNNWSFAEDTRHALHIYDRQVARERRLHVFGSQAWVPIKKGDQGYLEALTGEFRQLVHDPMVRRMAASKSDDPVEETYKWLTTTSDGERIAADWARQFHSPEEAAEFMRPDNLKAFLWDEYARMHLKTSGDWVFSMGKGTVLDSTDGIPIPAAILKERGWEDLPEGYHIFRRGDEDLLNIIANGKVSVREIDEVLEDGSKAKRMEVVDPRYDKGPAANVTYTERELRIHDQLDEAKWEVMKDLMRSRHEAYRNMETNVGWDRWTSPQFPAAVKGTKLTPNEPEMKGLMDVWDDLIDRMYDFWLGRPTRVFSRQPTLAAFYWERIGMLYPSMDPKMQKAYQALARKEHAWGQVKRIADEFEARGPAAPGTLTTLDDIDLNAKAYTIERTKDTLFDLNRQRNFVDGIRVIMPFAGPFLEAMEAWARVVARDPATVWRRGTQLVQHTWNTSGLGDDPDPFKQGWFWVDENGQEMFTYPWLGKAVPDWMRTMTGGRVDVAPISAPARGLNVVFGTEDLTQGAGPEFAGIPMHAMNPGFGPVISVPAALLMKDRQGRQREIFDFMFPYGAPDNLVTAMLPYNIRKFAEGNLGEASENELVAATMDQWGRMVANGEIGMGAEYAFDLSKAGATDEALEEANKRAMAANWFEAGLRTLLPSVTTPDTRVSIEASPELAGLDIEPLATIEALSDYARQLMTEEGAEWFITEDGYRVSTEGDYEVTTAYMNQVFGLDMFSSEFLSMPLTDRAYPRVYTDDGLDWVNNHSALVNDLRNTGSLLMPDYVGAKEAENLGEYSYEAFEAGVARGDASYYDIDEQRIQIESRLLKMHTRQIDIEAEQLFGRDEDLTPEEKTYKQIWVDDRKQIAKSTFDSGDIQEGQESTVFEELLQWDTIDWDQYDLTPEERATVDAVLWYLEARRTGLSMMRDQGVTKLNNKGAGENEQMMARAVREDMRAIVDAQFEHAASSHTDMGNFRYIYTTYLEPELTEPDEFDQMMTLAQLRHGEMGLEDLSMYGVSNEEQVEMEVSDAG